MTTSQEDVELIERAATRYGVPAEALSALLALEETFQNFSVFGAKADFSRQITKLLDDASSKAPK